MPDQAYIVDLGVPVGLKVSEHCEDDPQDFVSHCNDSPHVPPTDLIEALRLALRLIGGIGDLTKKSADHMIAFASAASFVFSSAFIVSRTHHSPGSQSCTATITAHVWPDLYKQHGRAYGIQPGNVLQDLPLLLIRDHRCTEVMQSGNLF